SLFYCLPGRTTLLRGYRADQGVKAGNESRLPQIMLLHSFLLSHLARSLVYPFAAATWRWSKTSARKAPADCSSRLRQRFAESENSSPSRLQAMRLAASPSLTGYLGPSSSLLD